MEITNEERVLQRLEQLQRRSYALQVAVKQLVAEVKVDKMKCGEVGNKKKDLLKVRVRRLFDVNTRLRNLARNHRRSKNLEENVLGGIIALPEELWRQAVLAPMQLNGSD